ncbi:MAG: hypothetical protein ACR2GB_09285 [Nocardioidaceae bacterium]
MNRGTGDLSPAEQRRRRDLIFGDVLPDVTSDERAEDGSTTERDSPEERDSTTERGSVGRDEDLRREVPPHHG